MKEKVIIIIIGVVALSAIATSIFYFTAFKNGSLSISKDNSNTKKTSKLTIDLRIDNWNIYDDTSRWDISFRYPKEFQITEKTENQVSLAPTSTLHGKEKFSTIRVFRDQNPYMNFNNWISRQAIQKNTLMETLFSGLEAQQYWQTHPDGSVSVDTYFLVNGFMYQFSIAAVSDNELFSIYEILLGTIDVVRENIGEYESPSSGWKEYYSHGVRFLFPSKLQPLYRFSPDLIAYDPNYPVQSLSVMVLTEEFIQTNDSPSSYLDGFSIHFPTTFVVELPVQSKTYDSITGTEKRFLYDSSLRRKSFFLIHNSQNQHYYLFQFDGLNNSESQDMLHTIYSSVQFE